MSIFSKLFICFFIINSFIGFIGLKTTQIMDENTRNIEKIYAHSLQIVNFSRTAQDAFNNAELILHLITKSNDDKEKLLGVLDANILEMKSSLDNINKKKLVPKSRQLLDDILTALVKWENQKKAIIMGREDYSEIAELRDFLKKKISNLADFEASEAYDFVLSTKQYNLLMKKQIQIATIIVSILGFMIAIFSGRYVSKTIKYILSIADNIAKGILNNEIDTKRGSEFGLLLKSINRMQSELSANLEKEKQVLVKKKADEANIKKSLINDITLEFRKSVDASLYREELK